MSEAVTRLPPMFEAGDPVQGSCQGRLADQDEARVAGDVTLLGDAMT